MIKVAICDAQPEFIQLLKENIICYSIKNNVEIDVISFTKADELLVAEFNYNVLFLDINLDNNIDGIELGCRLRQLGNKALFILATSLLNRHRDGYKANVFRYLEKPIVAEEFNEVLDGAIKTIIDKPDNLEITFKQHKHYINEADIIYIESYNRKRYVHTLTEKYPTLETLTSLKNRLPNDNFAMVQKTFLVNLKHVKKLDCSSVTMTNDKEILFSRGQFEQFSKEHISYLKR
ncbi:MAG: LytTR family DNA-binding domain-containing protein [Oscillospiraceae bacterium]